jgi:hypothetical protein
MSVTTCALFDQPRQKAAKMVAGTISPDYAPVVKEGYGVQLKINDDSAIFQNADPGSGGKIITLTASMGRVTANFTDTIAEQGSMTATIVKGPDGNPIANGPSDTEQFAFVQLIADHFALALNSITNNSPADGMTGNHAQAVVTDNGKPVPDGTLVKFTLPTPDFSSSAFYRDWLRGPMATFVLEDSNIAPDSDSQTIYVKTQTKNGQSIANAFFIDLNYFGETVTLTALLSDYPKVPPQTKDFTFAAPSLPDYQTESFNIIKDNAPADGTSENQGQVVVTLHPTGPSQHPRRFFLMFQGTTATFDLTKPDTTALVPDGSWIMMQTHKENGQDVANVFSLMRLE